MKFIFLFIYCFFVDCSFLCVFANTINNLKLLNNFKLTDVLKLK